MSLVLEVCVDSPEGLRAAIAGGADRIELCACLAVGGLTPSAGLISLAQLSPVPVYAIIRPRAGNFVYGADDEAALLADIAAVRQAGLAGVVIGANHLDGRLDLELLKRMKDRAQGLGTTLHRAFDLVPDPHQALEDAIALGVERVLTSGQTPKAMDGLGLLHDLVAQARGRVSIMPGSGVNPENLGEVLRTTGATEVHSSCRALRSQSDERAIAFGFQAPQDSETSAKIVRQMRQILDAYAD